MRVSAPLSSTEISPAGSRRPAATSARQAARSSAMSARSCSAARSVFFCAASPGAGAPGTAPKGSTAGRCARPTRRRARRAWRRRAPRGRLRAPPAPRRRRAAAAPSGGLGGPPAPLAGLPRPIVEGRHAHREAPGDLGPAPLAALAGGQRPLAQVRRARSRHRPPPSRLPHPNRADRPPDRHAIRSSPPGTPPAGGRCGRSGMRGSSARRP